MGDTDIEWIKLALQRIENSLKATNTTQWVRITAVEETLNKWKGALVIIGIFGSILGFLATWLIKYNPG